MADADQLSAGLFAEDSWTLGRTLTLNLGGRLDLIRADSDELYTWIKSASPGAPNPLRRSEESFDDTSWSGHTGLTWAATKCSVPRTSTRSAPGSWNTACTTTGPM